MTLLDGTKLAKRLEGETAAKVAAFRSSRGVTPGLATVLVGEDPASRVYVGNKHKACARVGIRSERVDLSADASENEILSAVERLNLDPKIHGILVQLPLPRGIDAHRVVQSVSPLKDVDGFHVENVGRLASGQDGLVPCTPQGVMALLAEYRIPLEGAHAVVIGRSQVVGKPVAQLLLAKNATVTIAHSKTKDLPALCAQADVVVAACGQPKIVRGDWIRPGAAVVDVGIHRMPDGKLAGDVDFASVSGVAGFLSPVPGGVGPLTIAMLLSNTLKAAARENP